MIASLFENAMRLGYRSSWIFVAVSLQLLVFFIELLGIVSIVPIIQYLQGEDGLDFFANIPQGSVIQGFLADLGILDNLGLLLLISLSIIILRQALMFANAIYKHYLQGHVTKQLRSRLLQAYIEADEDYRSSAEGGTIINNMIVEPVRACGAVIAGISAINYGILIFGYVLIILYLTPLIGVLAIILTSLIGVALSVIFKDVNRIGKLFTKSNQEVSEIISSRLRGARLVRLAQLEKIEMDRFSAPLELQRMRDLSIKTKLHLVRSLVEPLVLAVAFTLIFMGNYFSVLDFQEFALLLVILVRLMPVSREFLGSRQTYIANSPAADAILNTLAGLTDAREKDAGTQKFALQGDIVFDDVTYAYPTSKEPVIRNASFSIRHNKLNAIVGLSGSGKSTLLDLLPRVRHPATGDIRIGGVSIDDVALSELRRNISYASQFPQMFNLTVREFIHLGNPRATQTDIEDAARRARALDFIQEMPKGFDTVIGDDGKLLSGGQRRRLDLARVLLSDSPLVILDEPGAHLDAESETGIMNALFDLQKTGEATIILVTHQLSWLPKMDHVVVIEDGKVAFDGAPVDAISAATWLKDSGAA